MSAKKKILIATILFLIMIMLTIFTVVSVLAAQNVTVQSGVNVIYEVDKNIVGTIRYATDGKYMNRTNSSTTTLNGEETDNSIYDDGYGDTDFLYTLGYADDYRKYEFLFSNDGATNYKVYLTSSPTISNITPTISLPSTMSADGTYFTVPAGESKTYKITYTIKEKTEEASIKGTFKWKLTI